jgi:hypothetical protein
VNVGIHRASEEDFLEHEGDRQVEEQPTEAGPHGRGGERRRRCAGGARSEVQHHGGYASCGHAGRQVAECSRGKPPKCETAAQGTKHGGGQPRDANPVHLPRAGHVAAESSNRRCRKGCGEQQREPVQSESIGVTDPERVERATTDPELKADRDRDTEQQVGVGIESKGPAKRHPDCYRQRRLEIAADATRAIPDSRCGAQCAVTSRSCPVSAPPS